MSDLAKTVRLIRQAREMSLSALATSAGISVALVSLIESGKKRPSIEVLEKLALSLDIPLDLLVASAASLGSGVSVSSAGGKRLRGVVARLVEMEDELRANLQGRTDIQNGAGEDIGSGSGEISASARKRLGGTRKAK